MLDESWHQYISNQFLNSVSHGFSHLNLKVIPFQQNMNIEIQILARKKLISRFHVSFVKKLHYLFHDFSILHTILINTHVGKELHKDNLYFLAEAHQLGLKSIDPTICNLSTFPCQQRDLQPRTLCGLMKPICPVLKFSCRLCKFYLSSKSCRKTCKTYKKYCSSECSSSSSSSSDQSVTDLHRPTEPGKKYFSEN